MSESWNAVWNKVLGREEVQVTKAKPSSRFAVSLSDHHFPFADTKVINSSLEYLRRVQPDDVILNGDVVDFYTISRFLKDSSRGITLQREIDDTVEYLTRVRAAVPDARLHYNLGNHEDRLQKYLSSDAKALAGLECLDINNLLHLRELEIELHGSEGFKLNRSVVVRHGVYVSKHSGVSARMEFEAHLLSGVSGHTHRVGQYDKTSAGGHFRWVEQGCLCQMDPEYIPGKPNWQQGFATIEYSSRNHQIQGHMLHDRAFPG